MPRGLTSNQLLESVPGSVGYQRISFGDVDITSFHLQPSEAAPQPTVTAPVRTKKAIAQPTYVQRRQFDEPMVVPFDSHGHSQFVTQMKPPITYKPSSFPQSTTAAEPIFSDPMTTKSFSAPPPVFSDPEDDASFPTFPHRTTAPAPFERPVSKLVATTPRSTSRFRSTTARTYHRASNPFSSDFQQPTLTFEDESSHHVVENKPIRIKLPGSWRRPIESLDIREEEEETASSSVMPVVRQMPRAQDFSGPSEAGGGDPHVSSRKDVFDVTTSQFFKPAKRKVRPFEPLFADAKVEAQKFQLPLARKDVVPRQHRPIVPKKHISSLPVKSVSAIPSYYPYNNINSSEDGQFREDDDSPHRPQPPPNFPLNFFENKGSFEDPRHFHEESYYSQMSNLELSRL